MSLRLAFYGDDFTGSTDAMEALDLAGIRTVLFLRPPTSEQLAAHPGLEAIGVAGGSRTMSPAEMDERLKPVLAELAALGAPIVHYKVCSTFDSAPHVGSIGRAIEIGRAVTGSHPIAVMSGAPILGRFCCFGNLFARSGLDSPVSRLDRHPTMSRHPVTPMDESDLRLHLARQTGLTCALLDVLDLELPDDALDHRLAELTVTGSGMILFDVLRDAHLTRIGRLLETLSRQQGTLFIAGSSGVEYALAAHWQQQPGGPVPRQLATPSRVPHMLIVSGSCSPVSDRQLQWLLDRGAVDVPLDSEALLGEQNGGVIESCVREVLELMDQHATVVVNTCRGPQDPRLAASKARLSAAGEADGGGGRLGRQLGRLLRSILEIKRPPRTVVVGGDTSAAVGEALGVESLSLLAPIDPGGPLCTVRGEPAVDGMELVFKGGQVGKVDYLGKAQGIV
jgi:3-oxoisoapionate kinase